MLTGVLTISLFSAPSDTNRILSITIETTPIEGLKESKEVHQETINQVQKATASAPKTNKEVEKTSPQQQLEQQDISSRSEPLVAKPAFTEPDQNTPTASEADFSQGLDEIAETSPQFDRQTEETISQTKVSESDSADVAEQASKADESSEFIVAKKGLIQLASTPPTTALTKTNSTTIESPINNSNSPAFVTESQDIELSSKEQKKMERKIQRGLRKLIEADFTEPTISWKHKGQDYIASVTPLIADSEMHMDQVLVDVVTERDGKKLTTTLRLKQLAFSNFAQFVDQWDDTVMMHDDEMNGRFHSNSAFGLTADFKGAPVFHEKATTAAVRNNFDGLFKRSEVFLAGLETGVKKIRMPKPSLLFEGAVSTQNNDAQTIIVAEDSRLIFQKNGSVYWQALNNAQPMRKYELSDNHNYFIAAPGVSLSVRGTVNGLAAIYSPKRITIEGSINYASRDTIESGGDFLGLVSARNVYIAKPKIVGEGDLQVDAAIYAKDRFAIKGLRSKTSATLNIFGSVTSGSVSATEPRYATRIDFDPRLENMRPPGFPVTDRFEIVAEEQKWRVSEEVYSEREQLNELLDFTSESDLKKAPLQKNQTNKL